MKEAKAINDEIEHRPISSANPVRFCHYNHAHIADSNRWPPGFGHIDFKPIFRVLEETAYEGFLSVECLPKPNADEASERAIKFLRKMT